MYVSLLFGEAPILFVNVGLCLSTMHIIACTNINNYMYTYMFVCDAVYMHVPAFSPIEHDTGGLLSCNYYSIMGITMTKGVYVCMYV